MTEVVNKESECSIKKRKKGQGTMHSLVDTHNTIKIIELTTEETTQDILTTLPGRKTNSIRIRKIHKLIKENKNPENLTLNKYKNKIKAFYILIKDNIIWNLI